MCWVLLAFSYDVFIIRMCAMDSKSSTASVNISLNSRSYRKLTQLIAEDDRKYRHRIKKSKKLSLIITLLNIAKLVTNCRKYGCYIHQRAPTIRYFFVSLKLAK